MNRLHGDEHQAAVEVIQGLWAAQTKCAALSSLQVMSLDSCRELLMCAVDRAALPPMPEQRMPRGDGQSYTPAERQLLTAAARGLRRVDRELEGVPIKNRQTFGDHAELIEDRLGLNEPKPEPTTPAAKSLPSVPAPAKARGAALLRG